MRARSHQNQQRFGPRRIIDGYGTKEIWDQRDTYETMNNALHSLSRVTARSPKQKRIEGSLPFSVAHVSAPAFRLNIRQKENLVGAV